MEYDELVIKYDYCEFLHKLGELYRLILQVKRALIKKLLVQDKAFKFHQETAYPVSFEVSGDRNKNNL
jgi:hypothetical protein